MSEQLSDYFRRQADEASEPVPGQPSRRRRRRRRKLLIRLSVAAAASMVLLAVTVFGGGYLVVNHLASSIHRIHGIAALDAKNQAAGAGGGTTVLLTGSETEPASVGGNGIDGSSTAGEMASGLIALIHLNASRHAGAVVSIPANAVVDVPGYGRRQLWDALTLGGPSLLIETVERLTDVRIDHYSVLDFAGVSSVIDALGGVSVDVPYTTTSMGVTFRAGVNYLDGANVLPYVRQPTVSEIGREFLQQNLIRAILDKLAIRHLLSHFSTDYSVLHALASVLSVDSNFTNSDLESLAMQLGNLKGRDGAFVHAPTVGGSAYFGGTRPVQLDLRLSRQLWSAIRNNSVAAFARRYPFTVTPIDPG